MSEKQFFEKVWVEKYRPDSIKEVLLPKTVKNFFEKIVTSKELPNLLLVSNSPGTGKTSVAKSLCNELDADVLRINTSKTGIDVLRNEIERFAHVKSFTGGQKVVILEEFDGATPQLQQALRADIEQYLSCRFIMTANYITKIIEPLRSRCQEVQFNFTDIKAKEEMVPKITSRLINILKFEEIEYKQETIDKLVKTFYPDIRKMIQLLQQFSTQFGMITDDIFTYQDIDDEFIDLLTNKKITLARKYLMDRNINPEEVYRKLFDKFLPKIDKSIVPQATILIAQYGFQNSFTIDKEINLSALLFELVGLV
jgi:DNA polymerase III delta prime subunit